MIDEDIQYVWHVFSLLFCFCCCCLPGLTASVTSKGVHPSEMDWKQLEMSKERRKWASSLFHEKSCCQWSNYRKQWRTKESELTKWQWFRSRSREESWWDHTRTFSPAAESSYFLIVFYMYGRPNLGSLDTSICQVSQGCVAMTHEPSLSKAKKRFERKEEQNGSQGGGSVM